MGTTKDPELPKQPWEKRTKLEVSGSLISDLLQSYCNQSTVCYWHKNRHIDQWNITKSPKINLCLYSQYNGENTVFSINGKLDSYMQKNETGPLSYIILRKNSKWIKCKAWNHKSSIRKYRQYSLWHWSEQFFLHMSL